VAAIVAREICKVNKLAAAGFRAGFVTKQAVRASNLVDSNPRQLPDFLTVVILAFP
jgi:hypothetical protein